MTFAGFPAAALDFYEDLEIDNTKSFWDAHKDVYTTQVKAPMLALCADLEAEFGKAKLFRPQRARFAKDKAPYKTHQGAYVDCGFTDRINLGFYVEISAAGLRTGAGFYSSVPEALALVRQGIDDDRRAMELDAALAAMDTHGFVRGGRALKTAPRGYSVDHPRIELLRYTSMTHTLQHGFPDWLHTPQAVDHVRRDWQVARPFVEWLVSSVS